MKRLAAVMALIIVATLAGCAHPPRRGVVSGHWYRPAHTDTWYSTQCVSYGKNGTCTATILIPHHEFVPDRWQVQVRKDPDDTSKTDKSGWWDVDEVGYQLCADGTHWPECNQR